MTNKMLTHPWTVLWALHRAGQTDVPNLSWACALRCLIDVKLSATSAHPWELHISEWIPIQHPGAQGSGKGFAHSDFMQMQAFCFIIKLLPPSSSLKKNIYFMFMHVLFARLSMHHVHSWCPQRSEEVIWYTLRVVLQMGVNCWIGWYWKTKPGLLQCTKYS